MIYRKNIPGLTFFWHLCNTSLLARIGFYYIMYTRYSNEYIFKIFSTSYTDNKTIVENNGHSYGKIVCKKIYIIVTQAYYRNFQQYTQQATLSNILTEIKLYMFDIRLKFVWKNWIVVVLRVPVQIITVQHHKLTDQCNVSILKC